MKKLLFTYLIIINSIAFGQINRYWNNNFNAEASLTSGAVVASGAGPTALFFNPAQIAETKYANLTFNANVGTIDYYRGVDAFGPGKTMDKTFIYVYPRFFSIMAKYKKLENVQFQLAIFTRDREDFRYKASFSDRTDSIQKAFDYDYRSYYDDTYIGLGCGFKINKKFNMGLSLFGSFKTIRNQLEEFSSRFITNSSDVNQTVSSLAIRNETFISTAHLIPKIGFQYKTTQWHFGLNITIPGLLIYRSAKASKNFTVQNLKDDQGNPIVNQTGFVTDNKAKGTIKDPFSVALGSNWTSKNETHQIRFKMEYFHKINNYLMVDSDQQWTQSYVNSIFKSDPLKINQQASSVTNFAFGYSLQKTEHLKIMAGMRTDFNTQMNAEYSGNKLFTLDYNMYHFTSGLGFKLLEHDIIFGVEYSLGKNNVMPAFANLNTDQEHLSSTLNLQEESTFSFNRHRFGAYLGITFNFGTSQKEALIEIN